MAETIVLALNGGTGSRAALDWVIERARTIHVSLELTTVIDLARLPTTITKDRVLPAYELMLMDAASRVRREARSMRGWLPQPPAPRPGSDDISPGPGLRTRGDREIPTMNYRNDDSHLEQIPEIPGLK